MIRTVRGTRTSAALTTKIRTVPGTHVSSTFEDSPFFERSQKCGPIGIARGIAALAAPGKTANRLSIMKAVEWADQLDPRGLTSNVWLGNDVFCVWQVESWGLGKTSRLLSSRIRKVNSDTDEQARSISALKWPMLLDFPIQRRPVGRKM